MVELTNKELDNKYSMACQDIRNLIQELSLKIGKIFNRLDEIEKTLSLPKKKIKV